MWVKIKIYPTPHSRSIGSLGLHYENTTTIHNIYDGLELLGYVYPKYKLYLDHQELARSDSTKLSLILGKDDILHLIDPPFRRGVGGVMVGGAVVGGAVGYSVAKGQQGSSQG